MTVQAMAAPAVVPQYAPAMMQAVPQSAVATTVQTVSTPRDRIALGLEWVRLPVPFPRLFAVPGPQEVVTRTQYAPQAAPQVAIPTTVQAAPFVVPQAQMTIPQAQVAVPMTVAPAQMAMPAALPQAQMAVPMAQVAVPMAAAPAQVAVPQMQIAVPQAQVQVAVPQMQAVPQMVTIQSEANCYQQLESCQQRVQELESMLRRKGITP
jgi:hypothetical protein